MPFPDYSHEIQAVMAQVESDRVERLAEAILEAYRQGRAVFVIGNGGSGANASHLAQDLAFGTISDLEGQKRLRVSSLTDNTPWILALGNDLGYDRVFVEQLKNLDAPGDLLIAISGSGASANILRAVEYGNQRGLKTFGVTGFDGGRLIELAGDCLHVPCDDMGMVESVHAVVFHYLMQTLRERFADEDGDAVT
jgi:D-sedoheptulose 7-phosphate isomerase